MHSVCQALGHAWPRHQTPVRQMLWSAMAQPLACGTLRLLMWHHARRTHALVIVALAARAKFAVNPLMIRATLLTLEICSCTHDQVGTEPIVRHDLHDLQTPTLPTHISNFGIVAGGG